MHTERRLSPLARALRISSSVGFSLFIIALVLVTCSREFSRRQRRKREVIPSTEVNPLETASLRASHRRLKSTEPQTEKPERYSQLVDVETTNITVILEHLEVNSGNSSSEWMYSHNSSPFVYHTNGSGAVYANTRFTWNEDGNGDGSCASGGSGKISRGYLDPFNYFLGLQSRPDFHKVRVELRNLSLSDFSHINTIRPGAIWNTTGEAGDTRRYNHGVFRIIEGDQVLLSSKNVQWVQNLSYPAPVGEARAGSFEVGAYFVAEVQKMKSNRDWVRRLDPNGSGYIFGVITAASFGPEACFSSNSYWISLRGFPDFSQEHPGNNSAGFLTGDQRAGAKVGDYKGSSEHDIATARTLAYVAKSVVLTVASAVVVPTMASVSIAVMAPSATSSPPGQGLVRLLGTVAFVAKVNEIHGFHSDAMREFARGLRIFIGKVDWPWAGNSSSRHDVSQELKQTAKTGQKMLGNTTTLAVESTMRQNEEQSVTITDELFGNCAFYTTLIVVSFLVLHGCIWLAMRKRPLEEQLAPHAWMIYLFSIIMSHVYRAAVLNSMQYLRSHVGTGTGRAGLYVVAVIQLLFIGVGFTAFFTTIMVLAVKRVRNRDVEWIPKHSIADPQTRQRVFIVGEYKANDGRAFHSLFECYYASLAGPRLWLAGIELAIAFLDAICTAVIWNEVVCLAVLVCAYAILFTLFLLLTPFVNKIEGWLVIVLGLVELVLLIMDFLAVLGDYDIAESMEFGALVLGFVAIGLAVIIAAYCDFIPIFMSLWSAAMKRWRRELVAEGNCGQEERDSVDSEWSELSPSIPDVYLSHDAGRDIESAQQEEHMKAGQKPNGAEEARGEKYQAPVDERKEVQLHTPCTADDESDTVKPKIVSIAASRGVAKTASEEDDSVEQTTFHFERKNLGTYEFHNQDANSLQRSENEARR